MVSSVPLYRAREFELIALCVVSGIFLEQRATPFWRLTGPVITQAILECNRCLVLLYNFVASNDSRQIMSWFQPTASIPLQIYEDRVYYVELYEMGGHLTWFLSSYWI